jgi:hypothetical protein
MISNVKKSSLVDQLWLKTAAFFAAKINSETDPTDPI